MDWLTLEELKALVVRCPAISVSLFMPTHRYSTEIRQDRIRFKNLLREAAERLQASGLRSPDAAAILAPAERLQRDPTFWRYQSDGLAAFLDRERVRFYRLPLDFGELVVVANRFYVKPLLPMFTGDGHFFVLALSQAQVRLLEATRYSVDELELPGVPSGLAEALAYEKPERRLQFHTRAAAKANGQAAVFFGHDPADEAKDRLLRYFRQIDQGLREMLKDESSPLVLAGVDYLLPIYRQANSYPYLLEEGIAGNPDALTPAELHALAWELVEPDLREAQEVDQAQVEFLAGTGLTSTNVHDVVPAAHYGRVEVLFLDEGSQIWGRFDADAGTVELHDNPTPESDDLLNLAAIQTILSRGTVYVVQAAAVPSDEPLAAILRY